MIVFYGVTFRKKLKVIKFQFKIYTYHLLSQTRKLNYSSIFMGVEPQLLLLRKTTDQEGLK